MVTRKDHSANGATCASLRRERKWGLSFGTINTISPVIYRQKPDFLGNLRMAHHLPTIVNCDFPDADFPVLGTMEGAKCRRNLWLESLSSEGMDMSEPTSCPRSSSGDTRL